MIPVWHITGLQKESGQKVDSMRVCVSGVEAGPYVVLDRAALSSVRANKAGRGRRDENATTRTGHDMSRGKFPMAKVAVIAVSGHSRGKEKVVRMIRGG